jgi:hypothetical protein
MFDVITVDKCSELFASKGGSIIGDNDLREPVGGEDQLKLLDCGLRGRRIHHMRLYPL